MALKQLMIIICLQLFHHAVECHFCYSYNLKGTLSHSNTHGTYTKVYNTECQSLPVWKRDSNPPHYLSYLYNQGWVFATLTWCPKSDDQVFLKVQDIHTDSPDSSYFVWSESYSESYSGNYWSVASSVSIVCHETSAAPGLSSGAIASIVAGTLAAFMGYAGIA